MGVGESMVVGGGGGGGGGDEERNPALVSMLTAESSGDS